MLSEETLSKQVFEADHQDHHQEDQQQQQPEEKEKEDAVVEIIDFVFCLLTLFYNVFQASLAWVIDLGYSSSVN
jgi:hypothetical protein